MIEIKHERSGLGSSRAALNRFAQDVLRCAMRELKWEHASVTVLFCSNKRIHQLNRDFLGVDAPTDVLSFPAVEDTKPLQKEEAPYLGDIAVSLAYVAEQTLKTNRKLPDEIALLLIHGLLHLLGWDHDTKNKEKLMWREQERLLGLICDISKPDIFVA